MVTSVPANKHRKAPGWVPKSPLRCTALHRNVQRSRVLRVARRAIRQFYRENVKFYKGQVITSEAQLSVIFGQRMVDKVRAKINVDTQQTSRTRQGAAETGHRWYWTSLARSREHLADGSARPLRAVLFKRARWKLPARTGYLTFNVNSLIRLGRLRLILRYLNQHSLHAAGLQETRISGDRAEFTSTLCLFDANSLRYHVVHWHYGSKSTSQQVHRRLPHIGYACLPS